MHRVDGIRRTGADGGHAIARYAAISKAFFQAQDAIHVPGQLEIVGYHQERGLQRTAQFSISSWIPWAVCWSRLPVGSSSSTSCGRLTSARAIATRWRSPPDSSAGLCDDDAPARPAPAARPPAGGFRDRRAADQQRHADVLQGGELRQQVVELVDEAQRAVAQQPAGRLVQRREFLAGEPDAAGGGACPGRRACSARCSCPNRSCRR